MFDSVASVLDRWLDSSSCFWFFYGMSTEAFPELELPGYILATFTWDRALAEKQLDACNPEGDGFVAEFTDVPTSWRLESYPAAPTP